MSTTEIARWSATVLGGLVVLVFLIRRGAIDLGLGKVRLLAGLWILALCLPYMVGPASFVWLDDEGEVAIPYMRFIAEFRPAGSYAHALIGGIDNTYLAGFGGQFLSLMKLSLALLPPWGTVLVHKALHFGAGFTGVYLLCRRGLACERGAAATAAALFTTAHFTLLFNTYPYLTGQGLIPLVGAVVCLARGRQALALGVLASSPVVAMIHPIHGGPELAWTVVATSVLLGRPLIPALAAVAVFAFAITLNAAGFLDSVIAQANDAPRLAATGDRSVGFSISLPTANTAVLAAVAAAAIVLGWRDRAVAARSIAAVAIPIVGGWLLNLAIVHSPLPVPVDVATQYGLALAVVGVLLIGRAVQVLANTQTLRGRVLAAPVALAVACLIWYQSNVAASWIHNGGQSQFTTIDNLAHPDWKSPDLRRVVTVNGHKLLANDTPIGYGLESFDGWTNLAPRRFIDYWWAGILRRDSNAARLMLFPVIPFDWGDYFCCKAYDIERAASLTLLRVANVGYVVSPLPLQGPGLALVSGPAEAPIMLVTDYAQRRSYYRQRLGKAVHYGNVYVYALDGVLPRAYMAERIVVTDAAPGSRKLLDIVEREAPKRAAVIESPQPAVVTGGGRVTAVREVPGGYDVDLEMGNASAGVLVLNATFSASWHVAAGLRVLTPFPANQFMTAVSVPAGVRTVAFRFVRPALVWRRPAD